MRKKERKITDKKVIEEILKRNIACIVSFCGEGAPGRKKQGEQEKKEK